MPQHQQINKIIEMGVAQVNANSRDLMHAIAALAQENARARVAASAPAALTDNSGGTADSDFSLEPVATPTVAAQDGVVVLSPKAGFDTSIGTIEDAHQELVAKVNAFIALIAPGANDVRAISTAAAADGTIAAITVALAGVTAANVGVDARTGKTQIITARNNQACIASAINWCRVAMGLMPITDNSGGTFTKEVGADWVTVDAAATGAAAAAAGDSLTDASVDAALVSLVNNIASMADALDQMRGTLAIGPFVVATNNPHWKFQNADVTI